MKYSVITPVFNREDCIGRCMDSVIRNLNNEADYLEHIIIDDGSNDNTKKIVKECAEQYSHIHYISFPKNRGTNAARNTAITVAKGDFCIILDSDDYFCDNALETISNVMNSNPSFRYYLFVPDDRLKYCEHTFPLCQSKYIVTFEDFLLGRITGDFVHVVATSILKKFSFDEEIRIYEGVFFMQFYKEAQKIFFSKQVVTIRERGRGDSVSRTTFRTNKKIIYRRLKSLNLFKEWFELDLREIGDNGLPLLSRLYNQILENEMLCGNYMAAKYIIRDKNIKIPLLYKIIYYCRFGWIYRKVIFIYLTIKYNLLHRAIS